MFTATDEALDYNLSAIFDACAEFMNQAAGDGDRLSPAAVIDSFEDAHDMGLCEGERAYLVRRLADVAVAIDTHGPAL